MSAHDHKLAQIIALMMDRCRDVMPVQRGVVRAAW